MNWIGTPLAVITFLSSSTVMVPLKGPCTESRRSSEARLTRSLPGLRRTTTARRFSPVPSLRLSRMRASRRPMRPKP